jgi:hypothetical protein
MNDEICNLDKSEADPQAVCLKCGHKNIHHRKDSTCWLCSLQVGPR